MYDSDKETKTKNKKKVDKKRLEKNYKRVSDRKINLLKYEINL